MHLASSSFSGDRSETKAMGRNWANLGPLRQLNIWCAFSWTTSLINCVNAALVHLNLKGIVQFEIHFWVCFSLPQGHPRC